jgi:tetratricopeptide (TPR) repeat protein/TolB-like protein
MPSLRIAILVAAGALASASTLPAQCPDGTPPPCRIAAAVPARRANPPLDERTWIVLPFENVAHAQDIDWLRDASVNLLYLDLSKWQDIRVIDDERVADLMRDVPEERGQQTLGLQTGLTLARRAGAGKLVMGDLLKVGSRTQIVAKVFDVRSGQRLRSVREETASPDSLMGLFTRLARGILSVEPPAGATQSAIGTNSLGAYREYVVGVAALNAWNLDSARARFGRALQLDSTFALAHYKLSIVYGWISANAPERVSHAEAASRLGASLPQRERTLVAGQLAQARNRWSESCDAYGSLVRADSADVEAWYNLGECNYHDPGVIAVGGDTTHVVFRGSWNLALRAFRRTLELDPTYHLAFAHIPDILQAGQRTGCRAPAPGQPCTEGYIAVVLRSADSLMTTPVSQVTGGDAVARQTAEATRTNARRAGYLQAAEIARAWVDAGAGRPEPRARSAYGRALLRTGDLQGAARELGAAAGAYWSRPERILIALDQVELLLKLDRHAEAVALADSLLAGTDTTLQIRVVGAVVAAATGRLHAFDQRTSTLSPLPIARPYFAATARVAVGLIPESLAATERDLSAAIAAQSGGRVAPTAALGPLYIWGLRLHPAGSVALDTADRSPLLRIAAFMLGGDPARARAALQQFDSTVLASAIETPEDGSLLLSADAHLMLGDSAVALDRLVEFERRWVYQPLISPLWPQGLMMSCMLWGRTWLLMGDLAAARDRNDVAIRAYRRVVGMWSTGDSEVQPAVLRARQALATLGN